MSAARVRTLALVAPLATAALLQASSSAAPTRVVAWPGSVITYRYAKAGASYRDAVAAAAKAWNRLQLGVRFQRVTAGQADVVVTGGRGRCLLGKGGGAPWGFQAAGGFIRLTSSCPVVVRRLLVAHELGRVLGLPNDDNRCSLMNSHARSNGLTYVVPAKCSYRHPPAWIRSLIDPGTVQLAREIYTAPLAPLSLALSVDGQGVPQASWYEPSDSVVVTSVVARTPGTCPSDRDVVTGSATAVYDAAAAAGSHSVVDSTFPQTGESDCYRAFLLNAYGRATDSRNAITYMFGGPLAGFDFTAAPPRTGTPTPFADASTAQSGSIVHWHWDFGDPASGANDVVDTSDPAAGQQPSHVYTAAGTYDVSLTVTDSAGRTGSMLLEVYVEAGS